MKCTWFVVLCFAELALSIEHDFKGFDDSILFGLNWPGPLENVENLVEGEDSSKPAESAESTLTKEILHVMSQDQEKYECHLPIVKDTQSTNIQDYEGPSPLELLKPLFTQKICSFRLESYWNYEVCHGRYVRQYHDDREGKNVKTQEYYLGTWSSDKQVKLEDDAEAAAGSKEPLKTTKVEGMTLPYVDMMLTDGTMCDLNGQPRATRVMYVCYSHGKHEVYSFKEVSTCQYEIIILSPLLCSHPQFKPKEVSENAIMCHAVGDAPKKPRGALQMDIESLVFHQQSTRLQSDHVDMEANAKDILTVLKVEKVVDKDGVPRLQLELTTLDDKVAVDAPGARAPPAIHDDAPVRAFLTGENCLHGGTGWWRYELCYGAHVTQYHVDRSGGRVTLLLGTFDANAHRQWVLAHPDKRPKPIGERTSISHYYTNGDICDKTGRPRETEVKLKCQENTSSPAQVSLYLLEPRTCHYILGVESPMICDILPLVDEYGLLDEKTITKRSDQQTDSKERQTTDPSVIGNDEL